MLESDPSGASTVLTPIVHRIFAFLKLHRSHSERISNQHLQAFCIFGTHSVNIFCVEISGKHIILCLTLDWGGTPAKDNISLGFSIPLKIMVLISSTAARMLRPWGQGLEDNGELPGLSKAGPSRHGRKPHTVSPGLC